MTLLFQIYVGSWVYVGNFIFHGYLFILNSSMVVVDGSTVGGKVYFLSILVVSIYSMDMVVGSLIIMKLVM